MINPKKIINATIIGRTVEINPMASYKNKSAKGSEARSSVMTLTKN